MYKRQVVRSTPYEGLQAARAYFAAGDREADFVRLDLPGTVAAPGIFRLLAQLDHLFIPLKADKLVLELSLIHILSRRRESKSKPSTTQTAPSDNKTTTIPVFMTDGEKEK